MRGASAVQRVLDEIQTPDLTALIVWEPVLMTDLAPPTSRVLARIHDKRAVQYWDPDLTVSNVLKRAAKAATDTEIVCIPDPEDGPVWDYVSIYAPGVAWSDVPLGTSFSGCPVADVIDEVRQRLEAVCIAGGAPGAASQVPGAGLRLGQD